MSKPKWSWLPMWLLAVAVLAVGCKDVGSAAGDTGDGGAITQFDVPTTDGVTLAVEAPEAGQTFSVGGAVSFKLAITGLELVPVTDKAVNERGKGHVQIALDPPNGAVLWAGAESEVEVTLPADTTSGDHVFAVSLHEKNGDPLGIEQEVPFVAKVVEPVPDAAP